jgi:dihydroneopterin aldolase/2-amino-4-hydroxy-6-hydroxymethyldihydropteridine diphosphokinase
MTDQVLIRGLHLRARVGVTDEERSSPQGVVVDVALSTNLAPAGASDDLADTVDYASLITSIAAVVEQGEARLLETLAHRIVEKVEEIKEATGVTVEVSKEIVPVEEKVDRVSVRIERHFA